ncbi:menaquinone biosynthetic enzyme MqnA/MqnD family protein [Evansella clarkii]|jgi:chorismate dehydratase|uniref:menaquinone biosynthetic enzyme MqnA/MqnD family protein n=1 Tax=Evansella clarkii TaxID=79879 RepID=UPI000998668A|nr:menaquinone biosynthesis protein [Evansella clarkii]
MSLVIAEISYTNILPLFYHIDREMLKSRGCSFVPKFPAQLNRDMAEGKVHIGGISSFAYGEHCEEYILLPDMSVSSPAAVGSIFLFSKVPLTQLEGRSVALTSSSATSVNLLKIILKKFYNLNVNYETMAPDYQSMLASHDACLLIGDDAIRSVWNADNSIYRYDLGEVWAHFTSLPMTFAVIAARRDAWLKEPELLHALYDQFQLSKKAVLQDGFKEMIEKIRGEMGGSYHFWENYFNGLNYDLSAKHIEGLHLYYDLAYELGLLDEKVHKISLWQPAGYCQSV